MRFYMLKNKIINLIEKLIPLMNKDKADVNILSVVITVCTSPNCVSPSFPYCDIMTSGNMMIQLNM